MRRGLADLTLIASPAPNEHRMQGLPRPFAIRSSGFRKSPRALSVPCSLWPKRLPAAETLAALQRFVAFRYVVGRLVRIRLIGSRTGQGVALRCRLYFRCQNRSRGRRMRAAFLCSRIGRGNLRLWSRLPPKQAKQSTRERMGYRSVATVEISTAALLPVECCRQPGRGKLGSFRRPVRYELAPLECWL